MFSNIVFHLYISVQFLHDFFFFFLRHIDLLHVVPEVNIFVSGQFFPLKK